MTNPIAPEANVLTPWMNRWEDPWRGHWSANLRSALRAGAVAFQRLLGLADRSVGVIPAVYFTRLRMGSVPFFLWEERAEDVRLAFPWMPEYIPPPFTCFAAPSGNSTEEDWYGLIARVAGRVDAFIAGDETVASLSDAEEFRGLRMGVASWQDEESRITVADEWMLRESRVARTTSAFLLPGVPSWTPYVPLLYFQSNERYGVTAAEEVLRDALRGSPSRVLDDSTTRYYSDLRRAVLATAHAAHVRAREWLNQKTQLLNRAGFEGLKEDLRWRIANGEEYGEMFFDIDHFKKANDAFTYDGADLLAAGVTDRVVAFAQGEVARSYAHAAAARRVTGRYEPLAPDSFRALIAHVSGDEFRLFLRVKPSVTSGSFAEAAPDAFASGLVAAVAGERIDRGAEGEGVLSARHVAALRHSSAVGRAFTGNSDLDRRVLATRATVSAGLALPRAGAVATTSGDSTTRTAHARAVLNALDETAESAAATAKRAGRNCAVAASIRLEVTPA